LALFKYKISAFQAHVGLAYNNMKDTTLQINYTIKQYQTMVYYWFAYDFGKGLTASALVVNEGLQKTTDYTKTYYRNTIGGILVLANDSFPLGFSLSGYYQFGKSNAYDTAKLAKNITYADLHAFLLASKISYKFFEPLQIFVGADIFSGTKYSEANNKSYTFNKLYGTNHSYNGSMEYWTSLPKAGLKDIYFGIVSKPFNSLSVETNYHTFSLYSDFQYTNSKKVKTVLNHDLGSELDLTLIYKLSKETSIQGGYSLYFKNSNAEKVLKTFGSPTKNPQWAYIMLTIRPQFFKSPEVKLN
jgi:hypothetical protein